MPRTTRYPSRASFIADAHSIDRMPTGRQIDWANVAAGFLNASGKKVLPAGTAVGELLGAGKVSPRVVTTNPAIGFLETDAVEGDEAAPLSGYGVLIGGAVYEALMPDATGTPRTIPAAIKNEIAASGQSTGFSYHAWEDAR